MTISLRCYFRYTGSFPEGIARAYFQQLMAGLKHCHGHKVAHRDLKPENLLLTSAFGLKVADFGLSALSEDGEGKPVLLRTQCGTRGYMAPEVLARRPYDGYAADVWSCGVILFIMLAGFPPFQLASSSDWWFQRIRNKQYKLFWEAHLRVATISAGAQSKAIIVSVLVCLWCCCLVSLTLHCSPRLALTCLTTELLTKIFNADPKSRATMEEIEADEWYNASAITYDNTQQPSHIPNNAGLPTPITSTHHQHSPQLSTTPLVSPPSSSSSSGKRH